MANPASAKRVAIGELRGKYRLLMEIGHGGMADVYVALARGPSRVRKLCVLKLMRPNMTEDKDFLAMFLEEARLSVRLNHPNIVNTFEVGEEEGNHFIAMEFLEGQSLHTIINEPGAQERLPLGGYLRILIDVGYGLQYAYDLRDFDGTPLKIVHRDVSPHNIFVTYDGQVKVLDFGIAKAAGSAVQTSTGVVKGKITYMAPEQATAEVIDNRADVYSMGIMLWEAIAGKRRYKDSTNVQVHYLLAKGEKAPLCGAVALGYPALAEEIVQRAIDPKPENRFASAGEMVTALEELAAMISPAVTNRQVGKWLSTRFRAQREELRVRMEVAAKDSTAEEVLSAAEIPTFRPPSITGETPVIGVANLKEALPGSEEDVDAKKEWTATSPAAATRVEIRGAGRSRAWARDIAAGTVALAAVAFAAVVALRGAGGSAAGHEAKGVSTVTAPAAAAPATLGTGERAGVVVQPAPAAASVDAGAGVLPAPANEAAATRAVPVRRYGHGAGRTPPTASGAVAAPEGSPPPQVAPAATPSAPPERTSTEPKLDRVDPWAH